MDDIRIVFPRKRSRVAPYAMNADSSTEITIVPIAISVLFNKLLT
jgi:hypothetical protein